MFGRKTKSDRQRELIEQAEHRRRLAAGEPISDALRNPLVSIPNPEVAEALARYDAAVRDLERVSGLPDPAPNKEHLSPCEKHPEWMPRRPFPGAPLPRASQCPLCLAEFEQKPVGPDVWVDSTPRKEPTLAQESMWERDLDKREQRGEVLPGSNAEYMALERIKLLREEEQKREDAKRHKGGRVVYSNPFTGVTLYAKPRPRRPSSYRIGGDIYVDV